MDVIENAAIRPDVLQRIRYFSTIRKAVAYLEEHLSERVTLRDVAAVACLEATAFSKSFKARTGVTFRDFVQALRVTRAIEMMARSDYSVTAIAFAVGFNNLVTFERTFRRVMGMPPSAYRNTVLLGAGIAGVPSPEQSPLVPRIDDKAPTNA